MKSKNCGPNTGKKYIKLKGDEVATPEAIARARAFMGWFGIRFEMLRDKLIYAHKFDDEVAVDTAILIDEAIRLKGLIITGKYKWYYLRAYHTNYVAAQKELNTKSARSVDIEEAYDLEYAQYDSAYEEVVDGLRNEVLEYVRATFTDYEVSLFEMYVELYPEISYKKLAEMLRLPHAKVWGAIGKIKKHLVEVFGAKKVVLLSIVK